MNNYNFDFVQDFCNIIMTLMKEEKFHNKVEKDDQITNLLTKALISAIGFDTGDIKSYSEEKINEMKEFLHQVKSHYLLIAIESGVDMSILDKFSIEENKEEIEDNNSDQEEIEEQIEELDDDEWENLEYLLEKRMKNHELGKSKAIQYSNKFFNQFEKRKIEEVIDKVKDDEKMIINSFFNVVGIIPEDLFEDYIHNCVDEVLNKKFDNTDIYVKASYELHEKCHYCENKDIFAFDEKNLELVCKNCLLLHFCPHSDKLSSCWIAYSDNKELEDNNDHGYDYDDSEEEDEDEIVLLTQQPLQNTDSLCTQENLCEDEREELNDNIEDEEFILQAKEEFLKGLREEGFMMHFQD